MPPSKEGGLSWMKHTQCTQATEGSTRARRQAGQPVGPHDTSGAPAGRTLEDLEQPADTWIMIIQCGARRSGNYLLWRILHILSGEPLPQASYDVFYSSQGRLNGLIGYTHALPSTVASGIYLVRDGRDAVHSLFQFVVTAEYRARHPDCVRTDPRELLALPGFLERRVEEWRKHVRDFLDDPRPWHLVRYEDLTGENKPATIEALAQHLEIELTPQRLEEVMASTTVESCSRAAPGHVHSGTSGRALSFFTAAQLESFDRAAGAELGALGYPCPLAAS